MITWIILAVVVLAAVYGVVLYNRLVKFRQMVAEGWSGIDVQLKRRANLIPNLMESVKGYMGHERETLEEVTALRARAEKASEEGADPAKRSLIEGALSGALGRLFAIAENYPDLKASQNFIDFQDALEAVEEQIQLSRRYYNGAVRNLNVAVESFPSNLVASTFKFEKAEYFELEASEDRAVPKVSF